MLFSGALMHLDVKRSRVMAVASKGGHWVQLMRLSPAWEGCEVTYVSTDRGYAAEIEEMNHNSNGPPARFMTVRDASRLAKINIVIQAVGVLVALIRTRPQVIVTTGAAPGFFAVALGNLIGARTIWIDSIANADELSLSGRKAKRFATLCLTQWPHLTEPDGPLYEGAVL